MKITLPFWFLLVLIPFSIANGQQAAKLPRSIHNSLDKSYPGWRLSVVDSDVEKFFQENFPGARPDLISGDFDGDGQQDYAMLIEHTNFNEPGKSFTHVVETLVFLKKGKGYKKIFLEGWGPADTELYMNLAKKGAISTDFHTGKKFRYPTDSVSISYFEKAGGTYIYKRGKFVYVLEGD